MEGEVGMIQQTDRPFQRNGKHHFRLLPGWLLSITVLMVLGLAIVWSIQNREKGPPRPVGTYRHPRVDLIIQSNVGGAFVSVNGQQKAITSSTHNQATLFNLAPKTYQIMLKKPGYEEITQSVEVTGAGISQTVQIDMQLSEAAE